MITFDTVSFSYGDRAILRDLSLRILPGERACVRGASGRGKTTVLRLVMGLERPSSGAVTVRARSLSVVFQENRLLPHLTVAENCALFAPDRARVAPLLRELGLEEAADALPSALSGGMARRTALARALCHEAELYLLDEPFNGLDGENAARAAEVVNRVTAGKTLLAVTHHEDEARLLGCRLTVDLPEQGPARA